MGTTYHNKPIVTDGLVFCVDPANKESYISGSSTTFNLMDSNISGSLINDVSGSMGDKISWNFDGTDYIQCSILSFLNSATACTVSYWGYAASNGNISIMGYKNPSNWQGIQLFTSTYNGGTVFFRCMGGPSPSNKYALGTLTDNSGWHHYVGVYNYGDVGDRYMKCYIDGQQSGTIETSPPAYTWSQTGDNFRIGNEGSTYTNGDMSCIMMYNRALSDAEVAQNYNSLKNRFI